MHFVKRSIKKSTSTREEGAAQVTTLRRTFTLDRSDAAVTSGTTSLKGGGRGDFRALMEPTIKATEIFKR
jgi:hypothetical protein